MDYIPIQASSVPTEQVFSSAGETDTLKQNHTSPILMKALQMLKFGLKQDRLNFTEGLITDEKAMQIDDSSDADYLANLIIEDPSDAMNMLLEVIRDADNEEVMGNV